MRKEQIEKLEALLAKASKGPFEATPHDVEEPALIGPTNCPGAGRGRLAMFMWKCHPLGTDEQEERETYALVDLVAELLNAAPALLASARQALPPKGSVLTDDGRLMEYDVTETYDGAVKDWLADEGHKHEPGSRVWTSSGWMRQGEQRWSVYPHEAPSSGPPRAGKESR